MKEINKIKKNQKVSYVKFLHADNVGIIISTKPGQYYPIEKAEQLIAEESHEEAISVLESAVNKCRDLISVKAVKKQGLIDLTFNVIKENKTASIISSQVLVFLIILAIVFKKFIRKKEKKIELDF